MDNQEYRVDRQELMLHNQNIALEKLEEIESKCSLSPILFLKENYKSLKIRERKTEPNVLMLLAVAWSKISALAGIKEEIDDLIIDDITKLVFNFNSDLTIEEIYKAFELERYGVYEIKTEHYQLFNADYISAVIKKYRNWKSAIKQQHNIQISNEVAAKEISEQEKETILKNGINAIFKDFIETKDIDGPTEYIFDFLIEKRKIKPNTTPALNSYYQEKMQEAGDQLEKEYSAKKTENPISRKQIQIDLEQIVVGKSPKIVIRAKRNILIEFFNKQIELKQETIF